jgi:hypothetical protein
MRTLFASRGAATGAAGEEEEAEDIEREIGRASCRERV